MAVVSAARSRVASADVANVVVSVAAVGATVVLASPSLIGLVVAASITASAEVLWPLHDRRRSRASFVTDLTHAIGNRYLVVPMVVGLLAVLGPPARWAVPDVVVESFATLPWWGQLLIAFPLTDLGSYLGHRMLHRVPALWRLHAVHHTSEHLDWLATSRAHPLDLALNMTAATLPAYALGYADQQPWLLTVLFLYPFVAHANARLPWRALDRVLVSPAFHHWHHAAAPEAHDRNFGAILSVWDRLFGTAHEPGGYPDEYGIGRPSLARATYAAHLVSPLANVGRTRRSGSGTVRPAPASPADCATRPRSWRSST